MENIPQYVQNPEILFANDLRISRRISYPLLHCKVLSFILQPLEDCAIEHGLVDEMDDWRIQIEARSIRKS